MCEGVNNYDLQYTKNTQIFGYNLQNKKYFNFHYKYIYKESEKINNRNYKMEPTNFINGERLQQIADMYLGTADDFMYNPLIFEQIEKHQILDDIVSKFDNPPILFLYAHLLKPFAQKMKFFANPFTLITHNSDANLSDSDPVVQKILEFDNLVCWWGQNLCFVHKKMRFLPIGLANTMWDHGKVEHFYKDNKSEDIYFNFNIYTNREKREPCYNVLKTQLSFLPMLPVAENVKRLAQYKWCICPEGNGADTHRLWEAMYLGCVPIVVRSPFIDALMHYTGGELPIYIVESWDNFSNNLPDFAQYRFNSKWLLLSHYQDLIKLN